MGVLCSKKSQSLNGANNYRTQQKYNGKKANLHSYTVMHFMFIE